MAEKPHGTEINLRTGQSVTHTDEVSAYPLVTLSQILSTAQDAAKFEASDYGDESGWDEVYAMSFTFIQQNTEELKHFEREQAARRHCGVGLDCHVRFLPGDQAPRVADCRDIVNVGKDWTP